MSACIICLDYAGDTMLGPCGHLNLCSACTIRLDRPVCPSCRSQITDITLPNGRMVRFDDLLRARKAYDDKTWASTIQIVISAPVESEYASTVFRDRLLKLFPLSTPPDTGNLRRLSSAASLGRWRRKKMRSRRRQILSEFSQLVGRDTNDVPAEDTQHAIFGFPYKSRFSPNAKVDNVPVRFEWCRAPPRPPSQSHTRTEVEELIACRPDFLLLTCALPYRISYLKMLNWDRTLRLVFGPDKIPKRMWVFLKPPRFQPHLTNTDVFSLVFTDMQEDVYEGFNTMMKHERPITHHVLLPDSSFTRTIRTVATRSVFHARQFREISNLRA